MKVDEDKDKEELNQDCCDSTGSFCSDSADFLCSFGFRFVPVTVDEDKEESNQDSIEITRTSLIHILTSVDREFLYIPRHKNQ